MINIPLLVKLPLVGIAMLRLLLKPALFLCLLFTLVAALIRLRPYDDVGLRAFLAAPAGCSAPCWQGIRPGVTTIVEAADLLERHPWVDHLLVSERYAATGGGYLGWAWNGHQPAWIDGATNGALWVRDGRVQSVLITARISLGDVWLSMPPPKGLLRLEADLLTAHTLLIHNAAYPDEALILRTTTLCPLSQRDFWGAAVQIQLAGIVVADDFSDYNLRDWWRGLRCR